MYHLKPKCPKGDSHVNVWGQRIPHKGTHTWSLKWAQAGVTKDWMRRHWLEKSVGETDRD